MIIYDRQNIKHTKTLKLNVSYSFINFMLYHSLLYGDQIKKNETDRTHSMHKDMRNV
jgi:hypothetical protein